MHSGWVRWGSGDKGGTALNCPNASNARIDRIFMAAAAHPLARGDAVDPKCKIDRTALQAEMNGGICADEACRPDAALLVTRAIEGRTFLANGGKARRGTGRRGRAHPVFVYSTETPCGTSMPAWPSCVRLCRDVWALIRGSRPTGTWRYGHMAAAGRWVHIASSGEIAHGFAVGIRSGGGSALQGPGKRE